jgi:hypothetical protein
MLFKPFFEMFSLRTDAEDIGGDHILKNRRAG